eukprot:XP_001699532.1 predicted protein [Chlamydomonas reinhardtii]
MQPGRADTGIMLGRLCVANPSPSTGEAGGARGLVFLRSVLSFMMTTTEEDLAIGGPSPSAGDHDVAVFLQLADGADIPLAAGAIDPVPAALQLGPGARVRVVGTLRAEPGQGSSAGVAGAGARPLEAISSLGGDAGDAVVAVRKPKASAAAIGLQTRAAAADAAAAVDTAAVDTAGVVAVAQVAQGQQAQEQLLATSEEEAAAVAVVPTGLASLVPTTSIRVLYLLLRFCGDRGAAATPEHECPLPLCFAPIRNTLSSQQVRATLFGDTNATTTSVAGHMGYCANGRDVLLPENVNILDQVVIPCNGTRNSQTWSTSKCSTADMLGWGDAASAVARSRLGDAAFSSYSHVVLLLPSGWKAVADPSCAGVVASADLSTTATRCATCTCTLSHNLRLWHAGAPGGCDYCDPTCALGYCCGQRCPNTPHLWLLGWAGPVAGGGAVRLSDMAAGGGAVRSYRLPPEHTSNRSFVMVDATDSDGVGRRLFLGFRRRQPPYDYVDGVDDDTVHVYSHLSGRYRTATADTLRLGTLLLPGVTHPAAVAPALGDTYRDNATGLVFKLLAVDADGASVTLCRAAPLPAEPGSFDWGSCDQPPPQQQQGGGGDTDATPSLALMGGDWVAADAKVEAGLLVDGWWRAVQWLDAGTVLSLVSTLLQLVCMDR